MGMTKVDALKALYTAVTGGTCSGETVVEVIKAFTSYYEELETTPEEETP